MKRPLSKKKGLALETTLKETKRKRQGAKKKCLVPREYASETLTKAGRHSKIVSSLRNGSKFWRPNMEVRKKAFTVRKVNKETGRLAKHFMCAECQKDFVSTNMQVDHIVPLVDPCGFTDWGSYIDRLYCEEEHLQLLCKPCHKIKTTEEKAARSEYIKSLKEPEP